MTAPIDQFIEPETELFFEYHCEESHDSTHAQLWYRSHQKITVLRCTNADIYGDLSFKDRCELGHQLFYTVRFADGYEEDVFEDELMESESSYQRPNPPSPEDRE